MGTRQAGFQGTGSLGSASSRSSRTLALDTVERLRTLKAASELTPGRLSPLLIHSRQTWVQARKFYGRPIGRACESSRFQSRLTTKGAEEHEDPFSTGSASLGPWSGMWRRDMHYCSFPFPVSFSSLQVWRSVSMWSRVTTERPS